MSSPAMVPSTSGQCARSSAAAMAWAVPGTARTQHGKGRMESTRRLRSEGGELEMPFRGHAHHLALILPLNNGETVAVQSGDRD